MTGNLYSDRNLLDRYFVSPCSISMSTAADRNKWQIERGKAPRSMGNGARPISRGKAAQFITFMLAARYPPLPTEGSLRFINLTIRRINEMLIIKLENGCSAAPVVTDEDLQTSKTDKNLHGWGLESVRTAAGRYDGTVETEYSDHIFRAVVTLSFEAVKTK